MSDKKVYGIDDLLSLFEDSLKPQDVLSAKLMAQISSAITSERLRLRMSQQEFANHINVPQSLISRWEHGNYNFSLKKIAEIAVSLDLDVNISFQNSHSTESQSTTYYQSHPSTVRVIKFVDNFSNNQNNAFTSDTHSSSLSETIKEDYQYASVH